jgi:ubiquinone/menaquinone biosynthesis C-methylase UbiE
MAKQRVDNWKDFWQMLSMNRDPIAATDRPMVSQEQYELYSTEILKKLNLQNDDVLLDIGCGTGIIDKSLAEHVKKIYATDFSSGMAMKAQENIMNYKNIEVFVSDSNAIPLPSRSVSKAVIYAVAQYLETEQIERMIFEIERVLQIGGLALLGEVPKKRDMSLLRRIWAVGVHQGARGVIIRSLEKIYEGWLRISGHWTGQFIRPMGPPEILHSENEILEIANRRQMRGWILPQDTRLPWFHQTFDLVIEKYH